MLVVGKTVIFRASQHYLVSTVALPMTILGHDFETMVFPCSAEGEVSSRSDLYCDRYSTADAATTGHFRAVETFQP
jgi:hypothetical protein